MKSKKFTSMKYVKRIQQINEVIERLETLKLEFDYDDDNKIKQYSKIFMSAPN